MGCHLLNLLAAICVLLWLLRRRHMRQKLKHAVNLVNVLGKAQRLAQQAQDSRDRAEEAAAEAERLAQMEREREAAEQAARERAGKAWGNVRARVQVSSAAAKAGVAGRERHQMTKNRWMRAKDHTRMAGSFTKVAKKVSDARARRVGRAAWSEAMEQMSMAAQDKLMAEMEELDRQAELARKLAASKKARESWKSSKKKVVLGARVVRAAKATAEAKKVEKAAVASTRMEWDGRNVGEQEEAAVRARRWVQFQKFKKSNDTKFTTSRGRAPRGTPY